MISTQKTLWCDYEGDDGEPECGNWEQFPVKTNSGARKRAREMGWACHSGGDFCPDHNTK